nr:DUF6010 family protein [Streptomyces sp. GESEQ-35]
MPLGPAWRRLWRRDHEDRRRLNAVMVGGTGAAYLSGGGLGGWEFAFTAVATYVAYRGLDSWTFIGIGRLLHTVWDVVGCAICDPVIALWCPGGGRTPRELVRAVRVERVGSLETGVR